MDHQQQHEMHHKRERELEKKHEKQHEHEEEKKGPAIHPIWFLVVGVVLVVLAVLIWTFFFLL